MGNSPRAFCRTQPTVKGVSAAANHNSRTEEERGYLLPPERRQENWSEGMNHDQILAREAEKKDAYSEGMGRKFPSNGHVIRETIFLFADTNTREQVQSVVEQLAKANGWTALRWDGHRDEGYLDEKSGDVEYNMHCHILWDTTNEHGRVIKPDYSCGRERNNTERGIVGTTLGLDYEDPTRGRKNIGHGAWRHQKNRERLEGAEKDLTISKLQTKVNIASEYLFSAYQSVARWFLRDNIPEQVKTHPEASEKAKKATEGMTRQNLMEFVQAPQEEKNSLASFTRKISTVNDEAMRLNLVEMNPKAIKAEAQNLASMHEIEIEANLYRKILPVLTECLKENAPDFDEKREKLEERLSDFEQPQILADFARNMLDEIEQNKNTLQNENFYEMTP